MDFLLQALISGLLIGGVYSAVAVGLSLAFGVMRIINWAQGEFLMVSMYISFFIFIGTGMNPYLIMFISGILMFGVGYLLQSRIISNILARETEREPISVLLFTAGLGMFLTNLVMVLFGSNPRPVITQYTGMMLNPGNVMISVPRLISFVIAIACSLALYIFLKRTETGRAIRAVSQNRTVATLMGIDQRKIFCLAFGISIGLVGVGGALLLPFYPSSPMVGAVFGFRAFVVVILGGKGSVLGALYGGLIVGVIERVVGLYQSDTIAQMVVFIIFVGILLFRPNGLMGEKDMQGHG